MSAEEQIEVLAVGVCGSDLQRRRAGFSVRSLGHELVGRRMGQTELVVVRPLNPCGDCPSCSQGMTEQCSVDISMGRLDTHEGGFSGRVRAVVGQLYPIPDCVPIPLATLTDPLACVIHALAGVRLRGVDVLIIGDGAVAALTAIYVRQHDARVTIAVKERARIGRMSSFGHTVTVAHGLHHDRYHVVIESVGGTSSEPILTAVTAVAPLGQVVCLGVYAPHVTAGIPVRRLLEKESTLRGSKAYRVNDERDDFATALELLASGPAAYGAVVTSTPGWSPDDPQPPLLEGKSALKTVYLNELVLTHTERP